MLFKAANPEARLPVVLNSLALVNQSQADEKTTKSKANPGNHSSGNLLCIFAYCFSNWILVRSNLKLIDQIAIQSGHVLFCCLILSELLLGAETRIVDWWTCRQLDNP
jgi:hypothetical protein